MRACAYIRVSAVAGRDTETATSAPDQRRAIEGYVAGRDVEVVEWVEDFDESGGKWDRPGFQEMLAKVERGEVDGVIVAKLDRFSRSLLDALRAIDVIDRANGQFISVADNFDTTTAMGRAMLQVTAVFAELERSRIRENWQLQRADAIERGVQIGRAPLGYVRGPDGVLLKDSVAGPAVREVFLRRAAGASLRDLADYLETQLPERSFAGPWVGKILRNRTYLGEVRHGTAKAGVHEALVSRAEWEAAQISHPGPPREREGSLLAGFVRCAACGYPLKRTNAKGLPMYRCHGRHVQGHCPEPVSVSMRRLDAFIEETFLVRVRELERFTVEAVQRTGDLDAALAQLEAAETGLAAYRDAGVVEIIGAASFRDGLRARQEQVDHARRAVAGAQRSENVVPLGTNLEAVWRTGTLAERRTLLAGILDAVFVKRAHLRGKGSPIGDRVWIAWHGEAPADLPGRGGGAMRRFDDPASTARVARTRDA